MLIGYVSDEGYSALCGVQIEFVGTGSSVEVISRASGAIYADLSPGRYEVFLRKEGYGPKIVPLTLPLEEPYQFRLLSDEICGYAWPKWVSAGEDAEVRVHAPETYTVDLWRYGWNKEFVSHLGRFEDHPRGASRQLLPDGDFTQTGVNWNHFGRRFRVMDGRLAIKAPDRTGLYYFHVRGASGAFFSFPWIVAPAAPRSKIAVLASNMNWNAYNDYGGRSNYISAVRLPSKPSVNPRQEEVWFRETGGDYWMTENYDALSFDRPEPVNRIDEHETITTPMARIGVEHMAPAEWRFLGWLEREGFDYDYYAEHHLHSGVVDLDAYKVLIISTHPEYWTREMYLRVKSWVFERGGRLMYLGGNGINCMVELPDPSTMKVKNGDQREYMKHRSYRGEGAKMPSRFGGYVEEESNLLGVVTTLTGMGTGAPYRVVDASHWAFEGTGLANGDLVGHASLDMRCPGGASGHETDKMSSHSPANTQLLAKGTNPDDGGGEMVYFETQTGGAVFSVGSICYTCSIAVDQGISQITGNVLRRFTL